MHRNLRGLGEASVITEPPLPATAFELGLAEAGPSEEAGFYVFKHHLAQNGNEPNLTQFIDGDSDFLLTEIHGLSDGAYNINIFDHSGKPVYSSAADYRNVVGNAQLPVRMRPPLLFPAAGKIGISLEDTSAAPAGNDVEIIFGGIRRFRVR